MNSTEMIGITDNDKLYKGTDEAMCIPNFQAKLFYGSKTELNILLGLCVGYASQKIEDRWGIRARFIPSIIAEFPAQLPDKERPWQF